MGIKTAIYGASGYAGLELIRLLNGHPEFDIHYAASDSFAGQEAMGITFCKVDAVDLGAVEMVFLCTPHGVSAPMAKAALAAGCKVVDLSADLRLKTIEQYEEWYGHTHPQPDMLPTVYGLTEYNHDLIAEQNVIANPGCYCTTALMGLLPLAEQNAIRASADIIVDAKSGVSGAGRKPKLGTHFVEVFGDFKPYNIGRSHRHTGEIEQELQAAKADIGNLIFSPHLLPIDRGIVATMYVPLADSWTVETVRDTIHERYADEPLIELLSDGEFASIKHVARKNGVVISVHQATAKTAIVVSALDNLLKGASSQALQNANLMMGFPHTMGLL